MRDAPRPYQSPLSSRSNRLHCRGGTSVADKSYKGTCFCGAVELMVKGDPVTMGYCHCESCRHWSASPVNAFTLWKPDAVMYTKGADYIGTYQMTPKSHRQYCTKCGGHLMAAHPPWDVVDVYAAVLKGFDYKPQMHVNYGEKVLSVRDGLPKFKDLPAEMGGSGEMLPE